MPILFPKKVKIINNKVLTEKKININFFNNISYVNLLKKYCISIIKHK